MIRDDKPDENRIQKTLKTDALGRNDDLSRFIGLINSASSNTVTSVDGPWGSGKTYFVKQIEYMSLHGVEDFSNIDEAVIEEFQKNYAVVYYNAWENDQHTDPLQSLLANLINDVWGWRERTSDRVVQLSEGFVKSVAKVVTGGLYDSKEIEDADSIQKLVKSIHTVDERKEAIDDILDTYSESIGKKILVIIDELDRCRPDFAVKLLETIKHFYNNDNLIFVLATNNIQLSHTIRKVYGYDFDGIGYLNKFYDLIFNLPTIDREKYIAYLGQNVRSSYWKDQAPISVIKYLDMSMREINRYYSSMSLIQSYMESTGNFEGAPDHFVKYILVPLAYGLRVKNFSDYDKLIKGRGEDILMGYYKSSDDIPEWMARLLKDSSKNPEEEMKKLYTKINSPTSYSREDYHIESASQTFKQVITLMKSTGFIDEKSSENTEDSQEE